MQTKDQNESALRKKQLLIDMLAEHWDVFLTALQEHCIAQQNMPENLKEFTRLLLEFIEETKQATAVPDSKEYVADTTADEKGLLERAKHIISHTNARNSENNDIIVNKDGIFMIQKQDNPISIDFTFKDLVDSVL